MLYLIYRVYLVYLIYLYTRRYFATYCVKYICYIRYSKYIYGGIRMKKNNLDISSPKNGKVVMLTARKGGTGKTTDNDLLAVVASQLFNKKYY